MSHDVPEFWATRSHHRSGQGIEAWLSHTYGAWDEETVLTEVHELLQYMEVLQVHG